MSGGSGSAGGGGYSLQARMIALVGVHILAGEPLAWLEMQGCQDIPCAVSAETGGPGDDFRVELLQTNVIFEVQAKRGLDADVRLYQTIDHFVTGLLKDPLIHCILAIDPTASRPLQTHLLNDLNRLRQGREDRLQAVTQKVLRYIAAREPLSAHELAQRISLHVFDIERQPANERLNALNLLRRVLADPTQAETTWSTLVDDAMQLIQHRGRRDTHTLIKLLSSNRIYLANTAPATAFPRYLNWLEQTTSTFLVLGLGVRLPIEKAWVHLQALGDAVEMARPATLEAKIASYHEWERLSYREHSYSAQDVSELGHRVVVIGGPGAGKSTLCQRTAHALALSGERVVRARLPLVARRCLVDGESIDEVLLSVAAAGSGIQPQALVDTLNVPDCLLADGLDECGAYIAGMAEQLRAWAQARPRTRVVVTTRPIGYDRAFFEDWEHVELLPLGTDRIKDHVRMILTHVETDPGALARKVRQFETQIQTNRIASIAARSPLLLGFLVQLVHHHISFAHRRAALYEQVLTLWYEMPLKDRSAAALDPGAVLAHEVLNRVGWLLHPASLKPGGRSRREMIDALASQLRENGQSLLASKERVERCLAFWQERGVLELLQVGHEDAYTFIHATLGEYAAARYLATCSDSEVRGHLEKVRYDERWRETLLLAAGAGKADIVAEHLLFLDRENDPIATESLLAAAALAESSHTSPALAVEVANRITSRLCSAIPLVAYESAQNSIGLAAQLAEQMRPLLQPLFRHPQLWTRLTALRLGLAAGDSVVDFDALEAFFDDWLAPKETPEPGESPPTQTTQDIRKYILGRREPWSTFNQVLALGTEALVRARPGEATALRIERLARLKRGINDHAFQTLFRGLKRLGHGDIADQIWGEYMAGINDIPWGDITKQYHQADQALLEAVLRVTGATPSSQHGQRRPVALSMLIYALQLPRFGFEDWLVLGERRDLAALDVVLIGTIAALNLDQTELAADAAWILARVADERYAGDTNTGLLSFLPALPVEPDWLCAAERAGLVTPDLVHALCHPSRAIAFTAAQLLAAGTGGRDAPRLLEGVLEQGEDFALQMVALAARSVWGEQAVAKLLRRFDRPLSRGCRWLLRELPRLSEGQADEPIREVLVRGLAANDPYIAIAAAETLDSLPAIFLEPDLSSVQAAFRQWTTRGDFCEKHQRYVRGKCCDRVPLCPRAEILKLLSQLSVLSLHELLDACSDPHSNVRKNATQGVKRVLTSQPQRISQVIDDIDRGHYPSSVLDAILSLPTTALLPAQKALIALFSSESAVLRRVIVRHAATATWLTREQAVSATQIALEDSDLTVRNLAVTALRSLTLTS